jgi:hypothetical protein
MMTFLGKTDFDRRQQQLLIDQNSKPYSKTFSRMKAAETKKVVLLIPKLRDRNIQEIMQPASIDAHSKGEVDLGRVGETMLLYEYLIWESKYSTANVDKVNPSGLLWEGSKVVLMEDMFYLFWKGYWLVKKDVGAEYFQNLSPSDKVEAIKEKMSNLMNEDSITKEYSFRAKTFDLMLSPSSGANTHEAADDDEDEDSNGYGDFAADLIFLNGF